MPGNDGPPGINGDGGIEGPKGYDGPKVRITLPIILTMHHILYKQRLVTRSFVASSPGFPSTFSIEITIIGSLGVRLGPWYII